MKSFADYTLAELRDVARKYKEVTRLAFSKLKREELAKELEKHLEHDASGQLKLRKKVGLLKGYHEVAVIHKAKAKERQEKEAVEKMGRKEERTERKRNKSEKREKKKRTEKVVV